jgi:hypothetical protein
MNTCTDASESQQNELNLMLTYYRTNVVSSISLMIDLLD